MPFILKSIVLFILLATICFISNAEGDEIGSHGSKNVFAISSPIIGYSTVDRTIYDVLPFSYERAVNTRLGIRIDSLMLHYKSHIQSYSFSLSVPVYLNACAADRPLLGWYVAPIINAKTRRRPGTTSVIRGGLEVAYAWPVGNSKRFDLGVWHIFDALKYEHAESGLTLKLGFLF